MSVSTARSVIVLSGAGGDVDGSDALALRVVLSLLGIRDKPALGDGDEGSAMGTPRMGHVVVEVAQLPNEPLLRLLGGAGVETVVSEDVIGRLMLQCARQPGLSAVFDKLLGFQAGRPFSPRSGSADRPADRQKSPPVPLRRRARYGRRTSDGLPTDRTTSFTSSTGRTWWAASLGTCCACSRTPCPAACTARAPTAGRFS